MASESPREHPPLALLVGSVPCQLEAEAERAADAGWRFCQVPDVYAAAARLLRTDRVRPDAVLVLVESLRGDELRFFDLLARRWPDLPVAAVYCVCAEDRRLEACRLRAVPVLSGKELADWLIARHPAGQGEDPEPSHDAATHVADPLVGSESAADAAADSPDRKGTRHESGAGTQANTPSGQLPAALGASAGALPGDEGFERPQETPFAPDPDEGLPADMPAADAGSSADEIAPVAGVEVTLDLPDEWGDLEDLEDADAETVSEREYAADDLPDEPDDLDDQERCHQDEDVFDEDEAIGWDANDEDLSERIPLTPWSNVPRAQRRRPDRVPPQNDDGAQPASPAAEPARPASSPQDGDGPSIPAAQNPPPPRQPSGWEHGLLTPEELRALLQDPDDAAPREAQP